MSEIKSIKINEKLSTTTKPYYIGLDIGTSSIGYAVTNQRYEVIQKGRKSLWGVRLFQEAKTAASTRGFRSSRRNKNRRKFRTKLLQEYFAEEINKVDPGFFNRLKDSFYHLEDKSVNQTNTLFNDKKYTDKEYHEKYPTIYHLRHSLMTHVEKHDIREIYLAIAHIMKNRGHFLMEGKSIDLDNQFHDSFTSFNDAFSEYFGDNLFIDDKIVEVEEILLNPRNSSTFKQNQLKPLLKSLKSAPEFSKLLIGMTVSLDKLFEDEALKELSINKVKFSDNNFENNLTILIEELDGRSELIILAYNVYTSIMLHDMLSNSNGDTFNSLSLSRISTYDKHGTDLTILKEIIKQYDKLFDTNIFKKVFIENIKGLNNYVSYSGHVDSRDKSSPHGHSTHEDFLKTIKTPIEELKEYYSENNLVSKYDFENILLEIDARTFLPKISSSSNGVIPHQLHLNELNIILEKAGKHYSFLTEKVKDEIQQIFVFRIPYYVGPFNNKSEFAWIKRKSFDSIRPWNINKVVDMEETETDFIKKMTNKCTYLFGEDVLPKQSLVYSEYEVLNSLNNITIDGHRLDKETKMFLFDDLFVKRQKSGAITRKRIVSSLKTRGIVISENSINGMDIEIPGRLKSLHDFNRILPNKELNVTEIEKIIERITIFSEGGSNLTNWLSRTFGDKLSKDQIKKISKLKYKGWGRLSSKLLLGLKHVNSNQTKSSILDVMRNNSINFMEIITSEDYTFGAQIQKHNDSFTSDKNVISEEYLDNLYISPSVKKAIRQTVHLLNELFYIMGGAPEKIFIEMAREEGVKVRTKSRKNAIDTLYKGLKDTIDEFDEHSKTICGNAATSWREHLSELNDEKLKSKKLYLYYIQWGRCMYTGKEIDLNKLFDNNYYDIDHIYPRSLTKDDSWNNLVLVTSESNSEKSDRYPIDKLIRSSQLPLWKALHLSGFINTEKFNRLRNNQPLSEEQLQKFINRQLVETRQTTKAVANVLKNVATNSEIVYVKANHVSDFRYHNGLRQDAYTRFYFPKVRNLNDFHHAKDAYLNVVVGNAYFTKFTKNFYLLKDGKNTANYNLIKLFDRKIGSDKNPAWIPGNNGTIQTVNKMMKRENVLISVEAYKQRGEFFKLQILKKGLGQFPIKSSNSALSNINKYGGYNKIQGSHFCLIQHTKRKKEILTFANVPILLNSANTAELIEYFKAEGYTNPRIIKNNILYKSIVEIEGVKYRLFGKSGSKIKCSTIDQGKYNNEFYEYFKYLERISKKDLSNSNIDVSQIIDVYDYFIEKLVDKPFNDYSSLVQQGNKLKEMRPSFIELNLNDKLQLLFNISNLFSGKGNTANFSMLYFTATGKYSGKQSGTVSIKIDYPYSTEISIISQSISGFFENITEVTK